MDAANPFGHFFHDAVEDFTHADSRLWRTLFALLARPGFLTREFLAGRRAQFGQACGSVEIGYPLSRILDPQKVRAACRQVERDGGRSLREATLHDVPRAMFIFLPLIALVMKLLYHRPARTYLEHLLFLLHNHAFVLPSGAVRPIRLAAFLYAAWYLYCAMRQVYRDGRLRTVAKMTFLALSYA